MLSISVADSMDPSKKDTLIQWLNKINSHFLIESLHNLREGEQFIVLLNKIEGTSYAVNTKKECFEIIQKFIEDNHHHNLVQQVNFDKDNELDLAKIAVLMLTVGLEGEHQEDFIKAALSLNKQSQLEIMSILKEILNATSSDFQLDDLLKKSLGAYDSKNSSEPCSQENKAIEQSLSDELLHDTSNSNSLSASIPRLQRKMSLLTSTDVENEEINQKNMLLRKLNGDLSLEQHIRSEMEYDLEEKNKTISLKDAKIRELNNQIRHLKQLQDQLDEYDNLKEKYDQVIADVDKVKSQRDELKSLKLENTSLKNENTSLKNENTEVYEELNKLKEMKAQLKMAQLDRDKYLEELQLEQRKCSSLQLNLDNKQKVLDETIHSKKNIEDNLVKMRENYEALKSKNEEVAAIAFQQEKQPTGESMNVITDLIMTELKTELEEIKTTWIAPDIHKQLKIDLSKVTSERDIFESKLVKVCEESLSLQSNNNLFKNEMEKVKIEHDDVQQQILDKQHTIEILKEELECLYAKESNWQQTERKYKSELQRNQVRVSQVKSSIQNFAAKIIHATEAENTELEIVKSQLEENTTLKKDLMKQIEELTREKQKVLEKLELEAENSKEIVTSLKSKLESVKQSAIEQETKLKGDLEELTTVYTLQLEERRLEACKDVEQINVQLCEKDNRICELSNFLTEKSSLVEKYLNSNNELIKIVTNLKQNISEKQTETDLLKRELEEQLGIINEKDAKLDELRSVVEETRQSVSDLSQKHLSAITTLEEKHKDFNDIQVKLSQKEKELCKQRAEYDLVVAASDKLKEQYQTSVKSYQKRVTEVCNKVESQNRQIKCLQEQIVEMKVKAEQEYNQMKRDLTQCLREKDEEVKASKQEIIKTQSAYVEEIAKSKSLQEQIKVLEGNHNDKIISLKESFQSGIKQLKKNYQMKFCGREANYRTNMKKLNEKQRAGETINVITDSIMIEVKTEFEDIMTTCIAPDIHEQLKIDLSKVTNEQDIFESKLLKLWEESLSLQSNNDLLKNEMEKVEIEHGHVQQHILDKQLTIEKLNRVLESCCIKESNWQHTEAKYKSELQQNQERVAQVKSSLQNLSEKVIHATKANILTENTELPIDHNGMVSFLHQKVYHCVEEISNERECLQNQVTSQSVHFEEMKQNFDSQLKVCKESDTALKNQLEDLILEHKELQGKLAEQEKELERHVTAKLSLEETKTHLENQFLDKEKDFKIQLDCITTKHEIVKSQLEENTALKKDLMKQIEELTREKQKVLERLELETANSKEVVTSLKSKLESVKQSAIEQETKLKGDLEELTKVYTLQLEERSLKTLKEVEQINVQLCEKDNRICELSKFLTEKSSLVEKYLNSNNELIKIGTSLKQNISEKQTETDLRKKEFEEKSSIISEKDAQLNELTSIVEETRQSVSELSQKYISAIMKLEVKQKDFKDVQAHLNQKEEELSKQRAEYDLVVAASDKVKEQYKTSVKSYQKRVSDVCNKLESQNRQIKYLQEYNEIKTDLTQYDEEVKVSKQEVIKTQSIFEEEITKCKSLEEQIKMLQGNHNEKQPTGKTMNIITDHLLTELKIELEDIKTTWIAPDIHKQLKIDLSKVKSERDILESKLVKVYEESLSLQSNNNLFKNEKEKVKIEQDNAQQQILDKQNTIEKLKGVHDSCCIKEYNWQQTGAKYKSELQQNQERIAQVKSSLQNIAEKIIPTTNVNILTENIELEIIKSKLEKNTALKKDLMKQIEELTREKQKVLEKLVRETANFKDVVTSLKSKLESVKQSAIEQETKLKGDLEELTTVYTLQLEERRLEACKDVEQINVQLCEKDNRICELSNFLTEKSSLVEKYLNSNNELIKIVITLKQNISEKQTETDLLKRELRKQSCIISEKDDKLNEHTSIVEKIQQNVSEISQKHLSEIENLQENLKMEYEEKISSITRYYEFKITEDYICKSLVKIQEKEHSKELETARETLHQKYNQKSCCLIKEHEKKLKSVKEDFENRLSTDYVAVGEFNEQNKKHIQEVIQMKEKLEVCKVKIKSKDEEHKQALQNVMLQYQQNISKNYIPQKVFDAKLTDEAVKYTQLKERYVEKEEKLQLVFKEHEDTLAQVTLNYETKIATDFVPRQTFKCEQEKLATALQEQQTLYQEKLELLNEEHKIFVNKKVIEFEKNIATNYVMKFDFEDVQAKLSQKENEFSKQRAEYDLVVAASDKLKEQHATSVKSYQKRVTEVCNKVESQNRQIKCLQEQIVEMKVKAEQEYNQMKRDLTQCLRGKDEEVKASKQEIIKIRRAYEEAITKCKSLEEKMKVLEGNCNVKITSLKESFQSEIKQLKENFQKEFSRREANYRTNMKKLNDSHSQELALSQAKCEELQQAQRTSISNYEKIVTEKEHQVADIKRQLLSEKEAIAELEKYRASSKESHKEEINKLNSIINKVSEECQQLKKKNSHIEAYFHSREQKFITDHTKTLSKAKEMNTSLATHLQISHKELQILKKKHNNLCSQIESLNKELKTTKQEKAAAVDKECKGLKSRIVMLNEQLEKAELALFNNSSQSLTWANDSLESPASSTLKKAPYDLRSRTSNTWNKMKVKNYNVSPISVYSTSSTKSITSNASTSSKTPVPLRAPA